MVARNNAYGKLPALPRAGLWGRIHHAALGDLIGCDSPAVTALSCRPLGSPPPANRSANFVDYGRHRLGGPATEIEQPDRRYRPKFNGAISFPPRHIRLHCSAAVYRSDPQGPLAVDDRSCGEPHRHCASTSRRRSFTTRSPVKPKCGRSATEDG